MTAKRNSNLILFLKKTRWFSFVAVMVLFISIGILILIGMFELYNIISDISINLKQSREIDMNIVSAKILSIIDIYLLAVVLYIFAIGLFKLFIGRFDGYTWMEIDDINDLKSHIAKMTVLFLSTFVVQKIVEYEDKEKIINFGAVITAIIAVLIWFSISLRVKKNHPHDNP